MLKARCWHKIKAHKKLCIQQQLTSEDWERIMRGGIFDVPFVLNHGSPCLQVSKGILDQWINMCENMGSKEHKLNSGKGKMCCVFTDCESVRTRRHVEERQELLSH